MSLIHFFGAKLLNNVHKSTFACSRNLLYRFWSEQTHTHKHTISNFRNTQCMCARNLIQRLLFAALFPDDKTRGAIHPPGEVHFISVIHLSDIFASVFEPSLPKNTRKHAPTEEGESGPVTDCLRVVCESFCGFDIWKRNNALFTLASFFLICISLDCHRGDEKWREQRALLPPPPSNCSSLLVISCLPGAIYNRFPLV